MTTTSIKSVVAKRGFGILAALALVAAMVAPVSAGATHQTSVIYDSLIGSPLHGNVPSVGAEAYAFNELGNQVNFAASANRQLSNVSVTLSSWGCVSGHWYSGDCSTPSGATFSVPLTFNVYNPPATGSAAPGSLITSVSQTFAIPFRPSASPKCTGADAGKWYDNSLKACFNGLAVNVSFSLGGVTVPDSVVFGIAYNTTHYGYAPIGQSAACYTSAGGCGYDSLNIALATSGPTIGTDTNPGTIWQNSPIAGEYCDNGLAGTGFFRLDSPTSACWAPYTPAVQFKAGGGR